MKNELVQKMIRMQALPPALIICKKSSVKSQSQKVKISR